MRFYIFLILSILSLTNNTFAQNVTEADSLKNLIETTRRDSVRVRLLNELSLKLYNSEVDSAVSYAQKALDLAIELSDSSGIGRSYKTLGIAFYVKGDYSASLENYQNSLKIIEKTNDTKTLISLYNNIGLINWSLKKYEIALSYYQKAEVLLRKSDKKAVLAKVLLNIGAIYDVWDSTNLAFQNYNESLIIRKELKDTIGIGSTANNLGMIYEKQKKYELALGQFLTAIKFLENRNNDYVLITVYLNTSRTYRKLKNIPKATDYLRNAEELDKLLNSPEKTAELYKGYYEYYADLKNYKLALRYLEKQRNLEDSLFSEEMTGQIAEMETKYGTEKQAKENALLKEKEAKNEASLTRKNLQTNIAFAVAIALILLISIVLRSRNIQKKTNTELSLKNAEISQKNEEIQVQNEALLVQRERILAQTKQLQSANIEIVTKQKALETAHHSLKSSITYASRIQNAALPNRTILDDYFASNFIMYRPRDVVSGDFYWFKVVNNHIIVAAVDCTGHGVPGAFVSMLALSLLNDVVQRNEITQAAQALDELRRRVKESFGQSGDMYEQKDGFDISFCAMNCETLELQFAGAHNPLYLVRNSELIEYKGDKMPIGIGLKERNFTNHSLQLQAGDKLYLFSDGFQDQFGGENADKFKVVNFKNLLLRTSQQPMNEQLETINQVYDSWRDEIPPIDDVLVIGLEVGLPKNTNPTL